MHASRIRWFQRRRHPNNTPPPYSQGRPRDINPASPTYDYYNNIFNNNGEQWRFILHMFNEHNRLRKDNVTILFLLLPYALFFLTYNPMPYPMPYALLSDSLMTHTSVVLFLSRPLALVLGFTYLYLNTCTFFSSPYLIITCLANFMLSTQR